MAGPDTTDPTLTSVSLPIVNVTAGGEVVTFSVGALDSGSGVDRVYLYFDHSWDGQSGLESVVELSNATDSFSDGVSAASVYFDPSTPAGTYSLTSVMVYDVAGNWTQYSTSDLSALGMATSFTVSSNTPPDTSPPVLTGATLPSVDLTAGGETATFSVSALDSGSGVDRVYLYFDHGWEGATGIESVIELSDAMDSFSDGLSAASVYFDPSTDAGTYNLTSVMVYDKAGNWTDYSPSQLASLRIATSFIVTSPSLAPPIHAPNDFDGDGRSDILWRSDNGNMTDWTGLSNGGFHDNAANAFTGVPTAWQVAGTGDFNGDGRADIVWRNTSTGDMSDWLGLPNGGFQDNAANGYTNVPLTWQVVGVGDFNGDGRADILWRNATTGDMSDWLGLSNGGFQDNAANGYTNVPLGWQGAGVGDFNGDGHSDILWRNSQTGAMSDWLGLSNGGFQDNAANGYTVVPSQWQIAGVGDFNGDGRADILWRNSTSGDMSDWLGLSNGGFQDNAANGFTNVPTAWHVQAPGEHLL